MLDQLRAWLRGQVVGFLLSVLWLLPRGWWWSVFAGLAEAVGRSDSVTPPLNAMNVEGRKMVGVLRWYLQAMDPPRPTWSQLERWANLDDPETAEMRAREVRESTMEGGGGS